MHWCAVVRENQLLRAFLINGLSSYKTLCNFDQLILVASCLDYCNEFQELVIHDTLRFPQNA